MPLKFRGNLSQPAQLNVAVTMASSSQYSRLKAYDCMFLQLLNRQWRLASPLVELGATEAVQKHFSRTILASQTVSQRRLDIEHAPCNWMNSEPRKFSNLGQATYIERIVWPKPQGVFFYVCVNVPLSI